MKVRALNPQVGVLLVSFYTLFSLACAKPPSELPPTAGLCAEGIGAAAESREKDSKNDSLLYYMRLATFQQACGQYQNSAANFSTAKKIADDLYTKSVSAEALSLMVSDSARPYAGENYEQAFLRIFNALNFAAAGDSESAMVEARQVDFFLRELNQAQGGKNVYNEDAFGRYLTGMLHENSGDTDSARISYFKALEAYENGFKHDQVPVPPGLIASAMRMAKLHSQEAIDKVKRYGKATDQALPAGAGEVVLVHQFGQAPDKIDNITQVSWANGLPVIQNYSEGDDDKEVNEALSAGLALSGALTFKVALPKLRDRKYQVKGIRVSAPGNLGIGQPELVHNIGAIAKKDLDDRILRIQARAIARAAVYFTLKELALKKVRDDGGNVLQELAVRAAFVARDLLFEHADTRQWDSLPDKVQLLRVVLPEGDHTLSIDFTTATGAFIRSQTLDVHVDADQRTFAVVRTAQ